MSRITGSITGVTTGVDALLGSASYEAISPIYTGIKSFLCCTLADTFGGAWVALTMAGGWQQLCPPCVDWLVSCFDW